MEFLDVNQPIENRLRIFFTILRRMVCDRFHCLTHFGIHFTQFTLVVANAWAPIRKWYLFFDVAKWLVPFVNISYRKLQTNSRTYQKLYFKGTYVLIWKCIVNYSKKPEKSAKSISLNEINEIPMPSLEIDMHLKL